MKDLLISVTITILTNGNRGEIMKKFILLFLFCIIAPLTFSEVILQTNNTSPGMDEPFIIQIKFLNEDKKDYDLEGIENFEILSRSSQSNYSIINGKKSSSKSDIYQLIPLKKGKLDLQVKTTKGQEVSNKLTLNIQDSVAPAQTPANKSVAFETNLKNNATYYFGEKIPFYENFLSAVQIGSLGYVTLPEFNSFSVKDITPRDSNGQYARKFFTDKNGNTIAQITLYEGILMPDSSGEKKINLGKIGYTQMMDNDFFFSRGSQTRYLGGGTIELNILPLPQERPVGFQNVVGTPAIEYNWNKDKINYGDSVVLNISISGNVNLDTLDKIFTEQLQDFNIFENSKGFNEEVKNGKYNAVKNFEIAFIPKTTGKLKTPEVSIPYFNTKTKKFEEMTIPSKEITVEGSVPVSAQTGNMQPVQNQTQNESSSLPLEEIKIETISDNQSNNNINIIIGLIVLAVAEGVIILYLLVKKHKKYEKYDLSLMLNAKNNKDFYEAYCNFMKSKFKFSPKVHLEDRLIRLGFSEEFVKINQEIEEAYFSNLPIDKKEIIKRIKKELKNVR